MDREAIARIIDPYPFDPSRYALNEPWRSYEQRGRDLALAKADQILALDAARSHESERVKGLEEALAGAIEDILSLAHSRWSEVECTDEELVGEYRSALSAIPGEAVLAGEGNSSAGGRVPRPQMDAPTPSPAGGEG